MDILVSELNKFNNILSSSLEGIPSEISDNIKSFIFAKSKRIRPTLIFLTAKANNIEISDDIINLAVAVELIHNATLIHDDIIDNADTRRGKISLNRQIGNNLSVLSGDIILSLAMQFLVKLDNTEVINLFSKTLQKMCIGEINQNYSLNKVPSFEEYIAKSQNKTAELFSVPLEVLFMLNNMQKREQIREFAINFGIAFQIKDDLKNILKQDKTKPELSDVYNGIYTLPVIFLAQNKSDFYELSKEEIIGLLSENSNEIIKTKEVIEKYADKAIKSLDFIADNKAKQEIINLVKDLF